MKDYQEIKASLLRGDLAPVYLFDGEEPYYIDLLVDFFEKQLVPEAERDFDLIVLYGKDHNWKDVVSAARRFPMCSERLVVILKDAAQMKQLNELSAYVEQPAPDTVLVIEHRFKKADSRSKLVKLINKKGVYYTSSKLKETNLPRWIMDFCKSRSVAIQPAAAELLAAYLGADLQKVANEIEKMMLLAAGEKQEITEEGIAAAIGVSKEYNLVRFPDILMSGDKSKLAQALNYFLANPKAAAMPALTGLMYSYLQRIYLCYFTQENFQQDRSYGIWPIHRQLAGRHSLQTVESCLGVLASISCKSVGIDNLHDDSALLRELVGRMDSLLHPPS